jgi:hypothetical protein
MQHHTQSREKFKPLPAALSLSLKSAHYPRAGKVKLIGYWLPLGEKNPTDYVALGARLVLDNKLIRRADDARMNQLEHSSPLCCASLPRRSVHDKRQLTTQPRVSRLRAPASLR